MEITTVRIDPLFQPMIIDAQLQLWLHLNPVDVHHGTTISKKGGLISSGCHLSLPCDIPVATFRLAA